MNITRRDFLNGVAVTIVAGMAPWDILQAAQSSAALNSPYYPPAITGLRGSNDGSFEIAHELGREGIQFKIDTLPIEEEYDLIIVGAGISGLAAACFYRQKMGQAARILLLDNHNDFGGHAMRNEFTTPDGLLIGYGGSESLQSPKSLFSKEVMGLLKTLNVDVDKLSKSFDVDFYPNLGLSRGVYFDYENFGYDKVVSGDPGRAIADDIPPNRLNGRSNKDFISDFPLPEADRQALIELHDAPKDYLAGMSQEERVNYINSTSYTRFLTDKVQLSPQAIKYFQSRTNDFMAVGIDSTSCYDARVCFLPGFDNLNLPPLDAGDLAEQDDPYIFHFPDGNASLARLMVRHLIPQVAPGNNMDDIVLAKFDYSKLDLPTSTTRLRLNSTVISVKNSDEGGVDVVYIPHEGKPHRLHAKQTVMAGYNMMIPYIIPELPEEQKAALRQNVKAPLIYTNVIIRNWQPFVKLGVHEIYSPTAPYSRVKLDYPVSIGGYQHVRDPNQPICLHMVFVPTLPGSGLSAKEQSKMGRARLLGMPFDQHEEMIRHQLQGMLGDAGFDQQKDILAITVNRWSHGYSYAVNTLFDDEEQSEKIIEQARQPAGNITIANSDSNWDPYAHAAIDQAWRAVNELNLTANKE